MSMDKTFDLVQAGHKVRCLTMPFSVVDDRELAQNQTMTFTGRTVQEAKAKADAYMKDLVNTVANTTNAIKNNTAGINQRLAALERDERRGSDLPSTTTMQDIQDGYYRPVVNPKKKTDFNPPEPGEFYDDRAQRR